MVSRDYELAHPAPPPALKRFFDQRVLPLAIDAAGALESAALAAGTHARRAPGRAAMFAAATAGLLVVFARR